MAKLDLDEKLDMSSIETNSYTVLPEGVYEFRVAKVENGYYNGSSKLPSCQKLTFELIFNDNNDKEARVYDDLLCCSELQWKIKMFASAIGFENNYSINEVINKCKAGRVTGKAELYIDTFRGRDGEEHQANKVKKYLKAETNERGGKPW